MATEKSTLWQAIKEAGITPPEPFVKYTVDELKEILHQAPANHLEEIFAQVQEEVEEDEPLDPEYQQALAALAALEAAPAPPPPPLPAPNQPPVVQGSPAPLTRSGALSRLSEQVTRAAMSGGLVEGDSFQWNDIAIPVQDKPAARAGLTHGIPDGQPIRIDLKGRIWFRDEVQKPAVPKPRMTRTTRSRSTGVKQEATYFPDGHLDEIYEVAGDEDRELSVKTTLPSWQVGKYHDPRFPFAVHTYNGVSGLDFSEVVRYFGGLPLVPRSVKTVYVGNQLCYDIPTTKETIENQFNALRRGF